MSRRSQRQVMRSMLTAWGEYEAAGLWGAQYKRSLLGRLGSPRTGEGSGLPPIWVPGDVLTIERLMMRMRDECKAAELYERELRRVYVRQQPAQMVHRLYRAERWLIRAAFRRRYEALNSERAADVLSVQPSNSI